jgi:hypothetical protein
VGLSMPQTRHCFQLTGSDLRVTPLRDGVRVRTKSTALEGRPAPAAAGTERPRRGEVSMARLAERVTTAMQATCISTERSINGSQAGSGQSLALASVISCVSGDARPPLPCTQRARAPERTAGPPSHALP